MGRVTTNIPPHLVIVWMIALPGTKVGDPGLILRDESEGQEMEHPFGNIVAKVLHLFPDVS